MLDGCATTAESLPSAGVSFSSWVSPIVDRKTNADKIPGILALSQEHECDPIYPLTLHDEAEIMKITEVSNFC